MNLGNTIRKLRKNRQLSLSEMSAKCGISVNSIFRIERNAAYPHKTTLETIAKVLNVKLAYLFFLSMEKEDMIDFGNNDDNAIFKALYDNMSRMILNRNKSLIVTENDEKGCAVIDSLTNEYVFLGTRNECIQYINDPNTPFNPYLSILP